MIYNTQPSGAWLNNEKVVDGTRVKLVTECVEQVSRFKDEKTGEFKRENLAKLQFQGAPEPVNARINWTTIKGLIDAYGKDSSHWMGHVLTARVKDATQGVSLYLLADGYELYRDDKKRWAIRKEIKEPAVDIGTDGIEYPAEDIDPESIPF